LLAYRHNWGEHRVMYRDGQDRICSFPAEWTSVAPPDPYVVLSAGRSHFRPHDLMALVRRIRMLPSSRGPAEDCEGEPGGVR